MSKATRTTAAENAAATLKQIAEAVPPATAPAFINNLTAVIEEIKAEYQQLTDALQGGLLRARNIGQHLSRIRGELTNPQWDEFVSALPFSLSSAYAYIRVYRQWEHLPHKDLKYTDALKALAKRSRAVAEQKEEAPKLSPWNQLVENRMKEFGVKGKVEKVAKFLESFGVQPDNDKAAELLK